MRIFETCQTPKRSFTKDDLEAFDTLFPPVNLRLCSHISTRHHINSPFVIRFYTPGYTSIVQWSFSNESDRDAEFKRLTELEY